MADPARRASRGTVTVSDAEAPPRCASSPPRGLAIGDSGAAPLAALHALRSDPAAPRCASVASTASC